MRWSGSELENIRIDMIGRTLQEEQDETGTRSEFVEHLATGTARK